MKIKNIKPKLTGIYILPHLDICLFELVFVYLLILHICSIIQIKFYHELNVVYMLVDVSFQQFFMKVLKSLET